MSSDSESSRRSGSGSSRRSGSSRSKSETPRRGDLQPVDTTPPNEGQTNLLAVVIGMTTSLVILFGIFSPEVVNEKYDAEQSRRRELREEAERADSLEELTLQLANLSSARIGNFNAAANNCLERISLSKEIISRGPTDENMRQRAICEGIAANVKLYGLDFMQNMEIPDVGTNLEASYSPYLEDDNREVYEHARMGLLTHKSFEHIKSESDDLGDLSGLFSDTVGRFDNSEYVASMIEAHLVVLIELKPDYATTLYSSLRKDHPVEPLKPAMKSMMCNVADRLLLVENDFERKYADRWANGREGREELIKTSRELLAEEGVGELLVRKVITLGHWFEQNAFYEEAKIIYDELASAAKSGNILSEDQEFAMKSAKSGLVRLELEGSTVEFKGMDFAGKTLIDKELKQDVVVVVYWSVDSVESMTFLRDVNRAAKALRGKPISILAVCVDQELPNEVSLMKKFPKMLILEPAFESGKNSLLEVCDPASLPHVMLIGKGGKVADVNCKPSEFNNQALALLIERRR